MRITVMELGAMIGPIKDNKPVTLGTIEVGKDYLVPNIGDILELPFELKIESDLTKTYQVKQRLIKYDLTNRTGQTVVEVFLYVKVDFIMLND